MRAHVRLTVAAIGALLGSMALAATASGHADLLRTDPRQGQVLERVPRAVVLTFDEGIDPGLVRLQVVDAEGRRVDRGEMFHPGGREEIVAVRIARSAPGTYVARFRVISEDGHPVAEAPQLPRAAEARRRRGVAGHAGPGRGAAPARRPCREEEPEHLDAGTGPVTDVGFAAARALGYLAIALSIGGALFMFVAWLPALAQVATGGAEWMHVSATFARRLRQVVLGSVVVGLVATASAIVLETATAAGVSFWAALDPRPARQRVRDPTGAGVEPPDPRLARARRAPGGHAAPAPDARGPACRARGGGHRHRSRTQPDRAPRPGGRGDRARVDRAARRPCGRGVAARGDGLLRHAARALHERVAGRPRHAR